MTTDDDTTPSMNELRPSPPIGPLVADAPVTIAADASARAVAARLHEVGVGLVVVGEADQVGGVTGVVSERDIVRAVADGKDLDQVTASDIGSQDVRWISSTATVADAIDEMMTGYHRHLLVRDEAAGPVGVLSIRDLLAAFPG